MPPETGFLSAFAIVCNSQMLNHPFLPPGSQEFWFTGANKENFEAHIQQHVTAQENPASGVSMFAMRAHRAKVGLTRS